MATFLEAYDNYMEFSKGLVPMLEKLLHENKNMFEAYIREQLNAGINGNDKPLRPTYLNDPYFNTKEAGSFYKNARRYMKWKEEIRPPYDVTLFGIRRSPETPNLIIRGDFHDSITAVPIDKGLRIESRGVSLSNDIEQKYGQAIYRFSSYARRHFMENFIKKGLEDYFRKFGL